MTDRTKVIAGRRPPWWCTTWSATTPGSWSRTPYDWYAQDRAGNVWYFGEDTTAYDSGKPDTEGSWEAGRDGAPRRGRDARRTRTSATPTPRSTSRASPRTTARSSPSRRSVTGPTGSYAGVLQTEDTTPLEPKLVEQKYYAQGVGVVAEETVAGGHEQVRLVGFRRP